MAPKNNKTRKKTQKGYWLYDELLLICTPKCEMNGCGSKGISRYVPERIMLVDFSIACNIHDASYFWIKKYWNGDVERDELPEAAIWVANFLTRSYAQLVADETFLKNLHKINRIKSRTKLSCLLRVPILNLYYWSVRKFGHNALI